MSNQEDKDLQEEIELNEELKDEIFEDQFDEDDEIESGHQIY
jgi:hypothetical protein